MLESAGFLMTGLNLYFTLFQVQHEPLHDKTNKNMYVRAKLSDMDPLSS